MTTCTDALLPTFFAPCRTTGKQLGYVNQAYVDSATLEVASLYLRDTAVSLRADSTCHILLSSLRQIGDVLLVHDEKALLDPEASESQRGSSSSSTLLCQGVCRVTKCCGRHMYG